MTTAFSPSPPPWEQVLEQQEGVLGRRQALAGGLTPDAWQWKVGSGRWRRVLPGVVVRDDADLTPAQCRWVAVVHAGPGAALSGDAALLVQGLALPEPQVLHVAVPEHRRVVAQTIPGGVRIQARRVRGLDRFVHPVVQPPVLRVAPAVLHAVAWAASDRAGEWRLAAAVQQRAVRPADLRRALDESSSLRRSALVRTVLDDVELGAHAASELEFLRFVRRHGLPAPDRLQRAVRAGSLRYLDAWWERQRVAVEVDGAHHRSVSAWESDVLRGNDVQLAGRHARVLLLRFSTGSLRHEPARVAAQLAAALR